MRYADREELLGVIAANPQGITAREITATLWPERKGSDFVVSFDWVKKNIQVLKKHDLIEGGESEGRAYIWRLRA